MSLFRTLQSSPATITLFHNSKIPLSNELYKVLNKTYDSLPEKPKYDFQIDLMKNKMPTYEQYQIFVNKFLKSDQAKKTLHDSFPFLNERLIDLLDSHGKKVTIKGVDWANKVFSQSEYQKIYDTFNKLVENEKEKKTEKKEMCVVPCSYLVVMIVSSTTGFPLTIGIRESVCSKSVIFSRGTILHQL